MNTKSLPELTDRIEHQCLLLGGPHHGKVAMVGLHDQHVTRGKAGEYIYDIATVPVLLFVYKVGRLRRTKNKPIDMVTLARLLQRANIQPIGPTPYPLT